jgi:hypothetical protein
MNQNSLAFQNSTDFFEGHRYWDSVQAIHLIFNIILTFVAPVLNYAVIWYENNDALQNRGLLTNQLLSHVCIISIARCFTVRIASVLWLHLGPFSSAICNIALLAGRFFFMLVLAELTLWQFIKYLYLFWPKYLLSINDNFMSGFITSLNIIFNLVLIAIAYMQGFQNSELDYHICTGRDPQLNINENINFFNPQQKGLKNALVTFKNLGSADYLPALTQNLCWLLLIFAAQIWVKSIFANLTAKEKDIATRLEVTKEALHGAGASLIVIVIMLLLLIPSYVAKRFSVNDPNLINMGLGKLWTYIGRITMALVSYCMVPIITLINHPNLRRTVAKKIRTIFRIKNKITFK